jgi:hypothetical protein
MNARKALRGALLVTSRGLTLHLIFPRYRDSRDPKD